MISVHNVPGLFIARPWDKPLRSSSPHLGDLGYHVEWAVLNSKTFWSPAIPEDGCSLSAILIPDAPEKYFLSPAADGKALIQLLGGSQGYRVYDPKGVACTQTAGGGGQGVKTGLYLIPPPEAAFVDLCAGEPRRTGSARCLTARYGQTTLSYHRAERSGVLLVKEGTKKGYQQALIGDICRSGVSWEQDARRPGRETSCP